MSVAVPQQSRQFVQRRNNKEQQIRRGKNSLKPTEFRQLWPTNDFGSSWVSSVQIMAFFVEQFDGQAGASNNVDSL